MLPDPEAFAEVVAATMRAVADPLSARLAAVEQRVAVVPRDGRDGSPGRDGVDGKNGLDGSPGRDGADGTNASADFAGLSEAIRRSATAAGLWPPPDPSPPSATPRTIKTIRYQQIGGLMRPVAIEEEERA